MKYKLETDGDLKEIRTVLTNYQNKLMAAVSGIEDEREEIVSVPHQVKSVSTR